MSPLIGQSHMCYICISILCRFNEDTSDFFMCLSVSKVLKVEYFCLKCNIGVSHVIHRLS